MAKINPTGEPKNGIVITFTVAECSEFHSLGEYHEGIQTLEEAAEIYRGIPSERMHGIPAIGINLHIKGRERWEDLQADIVSGDEIDIGMICSMSEFEYYPQLQKAVAEIIAKFPEKNVVDI